MAQVLELTYTGESKKTENGKNKVSVAYRTISNGLTKE